MPGLLAAGTDVGNVSKHGYAGGLALALTFGLRAAHTALAIASRQHSRGSLGACWMCAPLFCPDVVVGALDLAATWQPQAIVTLGYPAGAGKPFSRRPLEDVVRHVSGP